MKQFVALVDFKSGYDNFEAGNKYTNHKISDAEVDALHKAGFLSIDGVEDNEIKVGVAEPILVVDDMVVETTGGL